ncbi:hypothetical protein BDEG_26746 [Batrachochytrium dendrobatidis JEL423]|uniref:BZIP domain-containing protein n=1 Tax=Batrachochytrium dendrobatidis (strain JEL423) TaxID=403673 RepID=A0A177WV80_BATDL|nr:hypothetical protein BDEG_26746 [Batrachochytrium dendrobatidis JEL423]
MKLAVTVLTSILFTCSFTTANPVNPSATTTTSAGTSTSTVIPTATTSTESGLWAASNEETTNLVDMSQLSESDLSLIEDCLQMEQEYEDMKKAYDLAKSEKTDQRILVERLNKKHAKLLRKPRKNKNNPVYKKELKNSRLKLQQERKKLKELEKKCQKLYHDFFILDLKLDSNKENLAERLFEDLDLELILSHMQFLELNRDFVQGIYESLNLIMNQQSGSEQTSTSGSQSSSQYHESPSSEPLTEEPFIRGTVIRGNRYTYSPARSSNFQFRVVIPICGNLLNLEVGQPRRDDPSN